MNFINVKLTILYGSQTGNSQDIAEQIWRESKRFYFTGSVLSLDDYNIVDLINEECVIFIVSTTGQGEEPDNMKHFWKFLLRKSLTASSLLNLRFAVLGLGDSSYVKYNFVAKRLNKRLNQLGGQELIPLGLGDDQHDLGYDYAADPWINLLFSKLQQIYPLPSGISPLDRKIAISPRWNVSFSNCINANVKLFEENENIYDSCRRSDEFTVTVKDNERTTTKDHFQDVRLIKFRTDGIKYFPGDVLVLRPKNLPVQVDYFLRVLKENNVDIESNTVLKITEKSAEMPVPKHLQYQVTFQKLCEEYFDLTAIPRRNTFAILAQLSDSELEKEKCTEFTTAEGQEDLYNYCNRPRRNIVEVLEDFPHATKNITPEILFELFSPIKPRDFSIASSFLTNINEVHILVAVVKYRTKLVKERLGLCSNYLADLKNGDQLSAWIKRGSFKFPDVCMDPVIMVGPGTGLAPFRNYINEQVSKASASKNNLLLFFGCRGHNKDFHCKNELENLHNRGFLNLFTAYSRDQDHKIYVQHKILEHKDEVWEAIKNKNVKIFIAGNSKNMPQSVRESFVTVLMEKGQFTEDEADAFLADLDKRNQYQTETWC